MNKKAFFLIACILLMTGCGKDNINLEEEMKKIGNDYYSKYMVGSNLDVAVISIKDIKDVNELFSENYDLSLFKNCTDESNIKIKTKKGTTQIESYELELNCK